MWTFLCIFFERFNCTGDNVKKKIFKIYHHIRRIKNKSLFKLHFFFTIFLFLKILFCTNKFEVLKRRIRSRNRTITFCISYFLNHMVYELYRFYVFLPAKRFFSISNSLKLYFLCAVRLFSRIFQNEKTHFHYRRRPFWRIPSKRISWLFPSFIKFKPISVIILIAFSFWINTTIMINN